MTSKDHSPRYKNLISIGITLGVYACWAAVSIAAQVPPAPSAFEALAATAFGQPQIAWQAPAGYNGGYRVERRRDVTSLSAPCLLNEIITADSWCIVAGGITKLDAGGRVEFTDSRLRLDPSDPTEYEYRVASLEGAILSNYISGWACRCDVMPAFSFRTWLSTLYDWNDNLIFTQVEVDRLVSAPASGDIFPTSNNNFYAMTDNRYFALFSRRGGLVSLLHRLHGKDYIATEFRTASGQEKRNQWSTGWILYHKVLGDTDAGRTEIKSNFSEPSSPPVINSTNGTLTFTWQNLQSVAYQVTTQWRIESQGSPGLHGNVRVSGNSGNTQGLSEIRFPVLTGLGFPALDSIYWPSVLGIERKNQVAASAPISAQFLQSSMSSQFFGLAKQDASINLNHLLYVAAEDSGQLPKAFRSALGYVASPGVEKAEISYVTHYPMNGSNQPGSNIDGGYDVVLQPMSGDWSRLAKRYRHFATQQTWAQIPETHINTNGNNNNLIPGLTRDRTDIPDSLRQGVFWWTQNNGPLVSFKGMADYANNRLKALLGPGNSPPTRAGIHLYSWYTPLSDLNFPVYDENIDPSCIVPDICDLNGYLESVQADGTDVMPYMNATLIHISNRCYDVANHDQLCRVDPVAIEKLDQCNFGPNDARCGWWGRDILGLGIPTLDYITRHEYKKNRSLIADLNGTDTIDKWFPSTNINTGTMARADLGSPLWHNIIDTITTQIFDAGATGIYLDTYGSGYDPDFSQLYSDGGDRGGRPIGHGDWWRKGLTDISSLVRSRALQAGPPAGQPNDLQRRFATAEHFSEAYLQDIDLFTIYGYKTDTAVPLVSMIYSDYQMFAGPSLLQVENSSARTLRIARSFTNGMQLGLTTVAALCGYVNCDQAPPKPGQTKDTDALDFILTLAQAREAMTNILAYGELLGIPEVAGLAMVNVTDWCNQRDSGGASCAEPVINFSTTAIQASRWLSSTGERVIVLTNFDKQSVIDQLTIPESWVGYDINCFLPNGQPDNCIRSVTSSSVEVIIPLLSARYLTFTTGSKDTDSDGLTDLDEINMYGTDPGNPDSDGDTLLDGDEINLYNTNPTLSDTDGDGVTDQQDIFPNDSLEWADLDSDGIGDNVDLDIDADGVNNTADNCPRIYNPLQEDTNANGIGDHCEPTEISGFWPGTANNGALIFIFGKNFILPNSLAPEVCFVDSNNPSNETCTSITQVISNDVLIAQYPAGAPLESYIKVTTKVSTVNGVQSLVPALAPTIFGITSPALSVNGIWPGTVNLSAGDSGMVFVFGSYFDPVIGATQVTINGVTSLITQVLDSNLLITFTQPGMTTGPVCVTVASNTQCSAVNLEILP